MNNSFIRSHCRKTYYFIFFSFIAFCLMLCSTDMCVSAEEYVIPAKVYVNDKEYSTDHACLNNDTSALGTLVISGDINKATEKNSMSAFGVESDHLTLSYKYDGMYLNDKNNIYIADDSAKKFQGEKLSARISKGILLVQRAENGASWEEITNPVLNFFETNPTGSQEFYTTSGADLSKGMYYRVLIAYKMKKPGSFIQAIKDSEYRVESYEFFACINNGNISIHNLTASGKSIPNYVVSGEGYQAEITSRGETLLDGSSTSTGFTIDCLGCSYNVLVNGKKTDDNTTFTDNGRYVIEVNTRLDNKKTYTVYIYDGGMDKGYSRYFDKFLVLEKRIFDKDSDIPVFARLAKARVKDVSASIPPITGVIHSSNGTDIDVKNSNIVTLSPGEYTAEFYTGNQTAGDSFKYMFHFIVSDEESGPRVNEMILKDGLQNGEINAGLRREAFKVEHYEVTYKTTGGGYIYICLGSEEEAQKYAYDIEKRYIERDKYISEGKLTYIDDKNPNQKKDYSVNTLKEKLAFTKRVADNSKSNVEIAYFDANDATTFRSFNDLESFDEQLDRTDLEDISINKSVRAFPSEEEKRTLLDNENPIANNYTFVSVGDYDVNNITYYCNASGTKGDVKISIPLKDQKEQFSESSIYTITEKNEYGDTKTYDVIFLSDNRTAAKLIVTKNGNKDADRVEISNIHNIEADSVVFDSVTNSLDSQTLIRIKPKEGQYSQEICTIIGNVSNLALYKAGAYEVVFIDRAGNQMSFDIIISGKVSYNEILSAGNRSYSDVFNDNHLNQRIDEESE
ncbi:MAG: hypothetical protein IJ141_05760 [Lachnospiraceae bacterium]|nr:hypothetical protein [Lachnospiraceae bacterium]